MGHTGKAGEVPYVQDKWSLLEGDRPCCILHGFSICAAYLASWCQTDQERPPRTCPKLPELCFSYLLLHWHWHWRCTGTLHNTVTNQVGKLRQQSAICIFHCWFTPRLASWSHSYWGSKRHPTAVVLIVCISWADPRPQDYYRNLQHSGSLLLQSLTLHTDLCTPQHISRVGLGPI